MKGSELAGRVVAAVAGLALGGAALALYMGGDDAPTTPVAAVAAPAAAQAPEPAVEEPLEEEVEKPRPKTKEEKRFARRDRDDDGRISLDEYVYNRRRAFDRLDANGDGVLSFREYAKAGIDKFHKIDRDKSGFLDSGEFATDAPKPSKKKTTKPAKLCACEGRDG